jgi:uncharacterized membrane protein
MHGVVGQAHEAGGSEAVSAADSDTATESSPSKSLWARLLNRYPALPPAPTSTLARICLVAVAALAVAYVVFFCAYLFAGQDGYLTHGEDLGIMDQALWTTVHGAPLHQTICNSISDTNCLGDVSRLAIHFEPILFPIALLYLVVPSVKTLFFLQVVVVATGAFPAYWIASRRLSSPVAGVVFAVIYLFYPALTAAVTFDFHAVTLSAAFLMFALYFMLTRNNVGLFIACLLALATKEEVPLDVLMIGLSVLALQRRWRVGVGLIVMAVAWIGLYALVVHIASPLGHSPTVGRYAYLGKGPVQVMLNVLTHPLVILRDHVFDTGGQFYLRSLLSPAAYVPLFAPLTLLLAAPIVALNLLSSDATMRSGIYQYNAEIVPFLVLASIEGVALLSVGANAAARRALPALRDSRLAPALRRVEKAGGRVIAVAGRAGARLARLATPRGSRGGAGSAHATTTARRPLTAGRVVLALLLLLLLGFSLREQRNHGNLPFSRLLTWPQQTAHTQIADSFVKSIPDSATVCAQATLIPHVSERRFIYQFPYRAFESDYVFLDVTAFRYPFNGDTSDYAASVQSLLADPDHHVVAAQDGLLLIARGRGPKLDPADPNGLSASFYTFAVLPADAGVPRPLVVTFGGVLQLIGYDVTPTAHPLVASLFSVVTYWRVNGPVPTGVHPFLRQYRPGAPDATYTNFVATTWHPMDTWQPGQIYMVETDTLPAAGSAGTTFRFSLSVLDAADHLLSASAGPSTSLTPAPDGGSFLASVQLG